MNVAIVVGGGIAGILSAILLKKKINKVFFADQNDIDLAVSKAREVLITVEEFETSTLATLEENTSVEDSQPENKGNEKTDEDNWFEE